MVAPLVPEVPAAVKTKLTPAPCKPKAGDASTPAFPPAAPTPASALPPAPWIKVLLLTSLVFRMKFTATPGVVLLLAPTPPPSAAPAAPPPKPPVPLVALLLSAGLEVKLIAPSRL